MSIQRSLVTPARDNSRVQIVVPKLAHAIANALSLPNAYGFPLAPVNTVLADRQILASAKDGGYALAVDSKGLPNKSGFYLIIRKDGEACFQPITTDNAYTHIANGEWDQVLFVASSAITAIDENRSLALEINPKGFVMNGQCIVTHGDLTLFARRAVLRSALEESAQQITSLLRDDKVVT
jgi:hypothetical protein